MTILDPYTPSSGTGSVRIDHYDLRLDYKIGPNRLMGHAVLRGWVLEESNRIELDLIGLRVRRVLVNSRRQQFSQTRSKLIIKGARPFRADEKAVIDIQYYGNPRPAMGTWGDVGWEELEDGVLVAGQPNGAATWFPCNDHPSSKATQRCAILVDSDYTAISNGELVGTERRAGRTEWTWESTQPLATYLATVQIGQYRMGSLDAGGSRPARVPLQLACTEQTWSAAQQALAVQHAMVNIFEQQFGPYPFPAYTVVVTDEQLEIPLESQPLSILGPNHLVPEWEAERLIAHELAHQWFGNSVTPRAWSDIWLNEGFACYAEWLWSEASGRDTAEMRARAHHRQLSELPQDILLSDPGPQDMFDDRVYKRGALTLHALRHHTGDEVFFAMLRAWCAQHRHSHATTTDFLEHARRAAGRALDDVLRPWLYELELPSLPG